VTGSRYPRAQSCFELPTPMGGGDLYSGSKTSWFSCGQLRTPAGSVLGGASRGGRQFDGIGRAVSPVRSRKLQLQVVVLPYKRRKILRL